MRTNIYQIQSFLTMDEYPNYEKRQNVGYFLHNVSPFQIFNRVWCVKNIKINRNPTPLYKINPGFYQVAVDTSKIEINNEIANEITPESILFIDYPIISAYRNEDTIKKILYLSNLTSEFSNECELIDFLHTRRDELCMDFYDILDILITYGKISTEVVDRFFTTD